MTKREQIAQGMKERTSPAGDMLKNAFGTTTGAVENKSKRLNLLVRPSIHAAIAELAYQNRKSTNDFINCILEEYVKEHEGEF